MTAAPRRRKDNTAILAGLRIVEGSAFVAAPLCGMTLAQLGAEVIRFDQIGGGLDYHRWPLAPGGQSLFWAGLNKNKRSVQVDLGSDEGQAIVRELITAPGEGGGIFVTNFPARGWLSYESLREGRPDLIMVVITGNRDGSSEVDYTVHPATGFPEITGPANGANGGGPVSSVLPAWDVATGTLAAVAVLAAERHRRLTGAGQLVELALSDVALAMTGHLGRIAQAQLCPDEPGPDGNYLYGAFGRDFTTADGRRVMVVGLTGRQWRALLAATGTGEVMAAVAAETGEDLATESGRYRARAAIAAALEPWFAARDLTAVRRSLDAAGVCWGPYQSFRQLVTEDPRCSPANPMFSLGQQRGAGEYLMPGSPLRFGAQATAATATGAASAAPPPRAPVLGADTSGVLAGLLGRTPAEIADLRARGIVAGPDEGHDGKAGPGDQ